MTKTAGAALLAAALLSAAAAAQSPDARFAEETRRYFRRLEKLGFSGEILVAKDGVPLLAEGYGLSDREKGTPWSTGTVTTLGSITKQFTAAAILALESDGLLSVNDPISKYFPGVPEDKRAITLHQLLTHSSGISDPEDLDDFDPIGREAFVGRILKEKLAFSPGTSFEYANANFSLLGAIVETVSGQGYERFLRDRLFAPNGIYETGYRLPFWGPGRLAIGYGPKERWGTILERPMAEDGPYWVLRANGGIHSTAFDVLRWVEALLSGRVLPPAALEKLWTPWVKERGGGSYGYGWGVRALPDGTKVVTHNGGNGIYFADLVLVPSEKAVLFVATNAASRAPMGLLGLVGRRYHSGQPYPEIPDVAPAPEAGWDETVGRYAGEGAVVDVTRRGAELAVEARGTKAFALLHSTHPPDLPLCEKLSRRMEAIAASLLKGDFAPLVEAYGGEPKPERLKAVWTERLDEMEHGSGKPVGVEVLGTAAEDERLVTLVRFRFERGTAERTFVWSEAKPSRLLGISPRGVASPVRCFPVAGGGFATWDAPAGTSVPVRFGRDASGRRSVRIGAGGGIFEAARTE